MDPSVIYFPSAVIIGGLHALEPGHAKTLTAAYLIGTKGTKRDATVLGLSVAFTHSLVVIGLALGAVFLGREAFTGLASYYLAVGSSLAVIALGGFLFLKRLRILKRIKAGTHDHHHAMDPVLLKAPGIEAMIKIINTDDGERFELIVSKSSTINAADIQIFRPEDKIENLELIKISDSPLTYRSLKTPEEPHEFNAVLKLSSNAADELIKFEIHEPHDHDHSLMNDDEHARAHAKDLPDYVHSGEKPSLWQVMLFGAAGGLIPCPAAVSVMLLSLSVNKAANGLLLVLGFSMGLAVTLVGIGLIIVTGISKLATGGRLSKLSMYAPSIAALLVMASGTAGLVVALIKGPAL